MRFPLVSVALRSPDSLTPSVTVPLVITAAEAYDASPSRPRIPVRTMAVRRRMATLPAGCVGVALLHDLVLALLEVAHDDRAALDGHLGAPAAILGQPLGAADG